MSICPMCELPISEDTTAVPCRSGAYHSICFDLAVTALSEDLRALHARHGVPRIIDMNGVKQALVSQVFTIRLTK